MQLKAFLMPRVVRFCLISAIRLIGIVAIILVISAEIQEIVRNIQGYTRAVHSNDKAVSNVANATLPSSTSFSSSILPTLTSSVTMPTPVTTPVESADLSEPTQQLAKRFFSYAAQVEEANATPVNMTEVEYHSGYVRDTTVPDHAGGIAFSTLFRFFNVLVLFFLLVSEISPPWPVVTNFYLRFFPPLSEDSSVGFLGAAMVWIATAVLSSDVKLFAMISAWILFIMGVLNVFLGLIAGPKVREHRALFTSDKSTRQVLPLTTDKGAKKSKVSYPAPISDIGFPAPAAGTKDNSIGFTLAYGAFDVASYASDRYKSHNASGEFDRRSEMVERSTMSPPPPPLNAQRARSGKGVVTIRTPAEEAEMQRQTTRDTEASTPPSYPH